MSSRSVLPGRAGLACLGAAWLIGAQVNGAAIAAPSGIDFSTYRPTTQAARIEPHEAPRIDGDLSDAIWQRAPEIDKFYQIEPHGGDTASERTVVRILYDKNALYVSFYCYDDQPKNIPLGAKARDNNVTSGDFVRIYLDPGLTRRSGYTFEVNVPGGREDGLLSNNGVPIYEWNTLWAAKTKRVADGWTVEIMIPFRSISYDAKRADWGLDLYRRMYRISERVRWTSAVSSIDTFDLTREGTLTGMHDISQGIGLDIQTYAALRYKHEWVAPGREDDLKLAESGNLYYKLTPALTGTLTLNPDFSNTPLDQRKINTTRFALFFPETRDFFLQDAAAFEFGGTPFGNNGGDPNGMPFFSRNVGLVNGVPVPIRFGGKLSGSIGGFDVGGFSALADGLGPERRQILSVARITHQVLEDSKIGFIFTDGDPTGVARNSVLGGDFQYHNSHFLGDKTLRIDTAYLRSSSNIVGDDNEYTLGVQYPNEPWSGRFLYRQIGSNFTPALGYTNRMGIRDYLLDYSRLKRVSDPLIQWYDIGLFQRLTTDIDNQLQSYVLDLYGGIQTNAGDQTFLNLNYEEEVVPFAFNIAGAADVPAGTYRWTYANVNFNTSQKRAWYINSGVSCCDFFGGKAVQLDFYVTYRPGTIWEFSPGYSAAYIDLPAGSVSIHVLDLKVNLNFSPDMQLQTEGQFDNLSQTFSYSARYRWEYAPGAEIFAAAGESALITGKLWYSRYNSQTSQASIRIGHTFRF